MTITPDLRLTFPVRWTPKGEPLIWAYHTPISRDVFQANWRIISATKYAIFLKGAKFAADEGPQIAALALQDAATADAAEYGTVDAAKALLGDLKRLTMILAPSPQGNEMLMVDAAIARGVITSDDWVDAESALVFFTCGHAMAPRQRAAQTAEALALVLMGSITSLPLTEWAASLPTSTTVAASPPPAAEPNAIPQ